MWEKWFSFKYFLLLIQKQYLVFIWVAAHLNNTCKPFGNVPLRSEFRPYNVHKFFPLKCNLESNVIKSYAVILYYSSEDCSTIFMIFRIKIVHIFIIFFCDLWRTKTKRFFIVQMKRILWYLNVVWITVPNINTETENCKQPIWKILWHL